MDKLAPDFTVVDGSRTVRLADYRGKIVLVNFWATWCAPCIEELPSLQALQKEMPQMVVLAVSIDDDPDAYRRFLADHQVTLLTVNDPEQHANNSFGTHMFPETYVVDRDGHIRRKFISAQDWTNPEIVNYLRHL
jgi:cytochrome c biogenesis protein CcmG, thiol:disulfide interchange protein DsbE